MTSVRPPCAEQGRQRLGGISPSAGGVQADAQKPGPLLGIVSIMEHMYSSVPNAAMISVQIAVSQWIRNFRRFLTRTTCVGSKIPLSTHPSLAEF